MATLAHEIGFSETTFVTGVRDGGYDVRIFTPDAELPFAGHPTLGTAFTMVSEDRVGAEPDPDVRGGRRSGGRRPGTRGPRGCSNSRRSSATRCSIAPPSPGRRASSSPISSTGCRSVAGSTGLVHLMVPLRDEAALRRARRDDAGCQSVCAAAEAESLYLFAVRGDGDVMARMFDRGSKIGEDPATGSAVGPLGAYLAHHGLAGMPRTVVVAQGEMVRRPSFLHVDVQPQDGSLSVRVGGGVRIVGEGAFRVG